MLKKRTKRPKIEKKVYVSDHSSPHLSEEEEGELPELGEEPQYSGDDSPATPKSAVFSQDEEFTDPDDPVTVVKTHIDIDKELVREEKERKQSAKQVAQR